jgi:hypothetical protein
MKMLNRFRFLTTLMICFVRVPVLLAQGYGTPLTIQGLDHTTLPSAASRGAGGITVGIMNDVGLMFSNPALLQSLQSAQFSVGGVQYFSRSEQVQQYAPLKYYSNFSLLMEGLTGYIPNPDTNHIGGTPGDTVQRPYDGFGPNWSRKKNFGLPLQAFVGVPVSFGGTKLAIGLGAVQYTDLRHYYQNNNVLSPKLLTVRPSPFPLPTNVNQVDANWFQYSQSRDGSIRGYGGSISGSVTDEISLGISNIILKGSSDDFEQHTGRGQFRFYSNYFRLDSVHSHVIKSGTSDYSGNELTLGAMYRGQHVTVGFSAKPPTTITRKYRSAILVDTAGTPARIEDNGEDAVRLPWRGTVGLSLAVRENLRLGFEYDIRPYASAEHQNATDSTYWKILQQSHIDSVTPTRNPWLSTSVFHVGAEYTPAEWLILRIGVRGQSEVFEPEGNAIAGEPVSYSIYSVGCGLMFGHARVNIAYEYSKMKYQDIWGGAVSLNNTQRHTIVADVAYELPR